MTRVTWCENAGTIRREKRLFKNLDEKGINGSKISREMHRPLKKE